MLSSIPTVPLDPPADPPENWRERILSALASEGVTEPTYVPAWRLFIINFAEIVCWVILCVLPTVAVLLAREYFPDIVDDRAFPPLFLGSFLADFIVFCAFNISAHLRAAGRKWRVEWHGRNPTHAVMKAQRAPIFYLRAFSFDAAAAMQANYGSLAPEETLIWRMRRYAPVLAIGRPHDRDGAQGALRFYVTDARWEAVVKDIVPCCRLVVWVSGSTQGLTWEIQHLVASLAPHRLLLWPNVNLEAVKSSGDDWKGTAPRRNAEWQQFVDAHAAVFPKPLPRDIAETRFVAFDADWTPIPIPSARYPVWRVEPFDLVAGLRAFLEEAYQRPGAPASDSNADPQAGDRISIPVPK
jgi:hypothetical protein